MTGSLDRPTTGLATLARLHLLALKQGVSAAFRRGGEESERVNVMVRWRAGTRIRMRGVRFIAQGTHGCWDRRIEWGDSLSSIRLRTQAFSDACCARLVGGKVPFYDEQTMIDVCVRVSEMLIEEVYWC